MSKQNNMRVALVACGITNLLSFVFMILLAVKNEPGSSSVPVPVVFFLVTTFVNTALSCIYAGYLRREKLKWGLAGFMLPQIAPLILAFLGEETYKPGKFGKAGFTLSDNALSFKRGPFTQITLPLDSLRIVTLVMPYSFQNNVLSYSKETSYTQLDLLQEEAFSGYIKTLKELWDTLGSYDERPCSDRKKLSLMDHCKIHLVDYCNNHACFSMKDIKISETDLLDRLASCRNERIKKLDRWKDGNPAISFRGSFGITASLTKEGYKKGGKFVPWKEVGTVYCQPVSSLGMSELYVLPKGVKAGPFSLEKAAYWMRVSNKQKDLLLTECMFFWNLFGGERTAG